MNLGDVLPGTTTAITGHDKGCGKTTFLKHALAVAQVAGPVAVASIGVDGALKASVLGPTPEIVVAPGDVVLTTEAFARASDARFEVLERVPGRSVLGRLMLGRAVRGGSITLVGCEHLSVLADLLALIRAEGWAETALVDGAVNRLTQVRALGELQFAYTVRVDPANLKRVAVRLRALVALLQLPAASDAAARRIEGPLTLEVLQALPPQTASFVLEDFTKVFLEPEVTLRTLERHQVSVRHPYRMLAVVAVLRNVSRAAFLDAVGADVAPWVLFNPHEVAA